MSCYVTPRYVNTHSKCLSDDQPGFTTFQQQKKKLKKPRMLRGTSLQ